MHLFLARYTAALIYIISGGLTLVQPGQLTKFFSAAVKFLNKLYNFDKFLHEGKANVLRPWHNK